MSATRVRFVGSPQLLEQIKSFGRYLGPWDGYGTGPCGSTTPHRVAVLELARDYLLVVRDSTPAIGNVEQPADLRVGNADRRPLMPVSSSYTKSKI